MKKAAQKLLAVQGSGFGIAEAMPAQIFATIQAQTRARKKHVEPPAGRAVTASAATDMLNFV